MNKDLLITAGLVSMVMIWPVYHFTGSYSLLQETPLIERIGAASAFALMAGICFIFAYKHAKYQPSQRENIDFWPDNPTGPTRPTLDEPVESGVDSDTWLKQWTDSKERTSPE
jgi:hypothetical protein